MSSIGRLRETIGLSNRGAGDKGPPGMTERTIDMKLQLNRDYNIKPDFAFDLKGMNARMKDLEAFRDECPLVSDDWIASITSILDFQLEDGSFALAENYLDMPFSERFYYVYRPSYACCQALMKAAACILVHGFPVVDEPELDPAIKRELADRTMEALRRGLAFCCTRKLVGDGYDGIKQQIEDIHNFERAAIRLFASEHRDLCPEFFDMVDEILESCQRKVAEFDAFGGNHAQAIMDLLEEFDIYPQVNVFVYGTLMAGMRNSHLIQASPYLGNARLEGYTLFDLGAYPGIVSSSRVAHHDSTVLGEVRRVDTDTLRALDQLEGEGSLYKATRAKLTTPAGTMYALAYVYLHQVEPSAEIPVALQPYNRYIAVRDNYVWYVAYGSNINFERFMTYIQGGTCRFNNRTYAGCEDKSAPLACQPFTLPYDVYFGNESPSWNDWGVAFLDTSAPGHAMGRAYLITREQFKELHRAEGSSDSWYPNVVDLGLVAGIPAMTFTNNVHREFNEPDSDYLDVLAEGLLETYPALTEPQMYGYLESLRWE